MRRSRESLCAHRGGAEDAKKTQRSFEIEISKSFSLRFLCVLCASAVKKSSASMVLESYERNKPAYSPGAEEVRLMSKGAEWKARRKAKRKSPAARWAADHDGSYKHLFSHPEMVRDLISGFVEGEWVKEVDFATLEKVSGSYVSDDLRDREDDIIWRVRLRGSWLYVYLLLEFQSSIDPFMAVRIMAYVSLLYQDLIKSGWVKAGEKLSPVLPLVLYNGEPRWNALLSVEELIEEAPRGLEIYRPAMKYLVLDEGAYGEGTLEPLRNLAAALFRMENSRAPEDIQRVVECLVIWLDAEEQGSLRRAFTVWIRRVLLPGRLPGVELPEVRNLQEVRSMLAERSRNWTEEWKREGMKEGLEEGLKEGLKEGVKEGLKQGVEQGAQQGRAQMLKRLLKKRFGALPGEVLQRIDTASASELDAWGENLLDSGTLDDVFVISR